MQGEEMKKEKDMEYFQIKQETQYAKTNRVLPKKDLFLQPVRWSNGVFKYKVNTFFGQPDYIQSQ